MTSDGMRPAGRRTSQALVDVDAIEWPSCLSARAVRILEKLKGIGPAEGYLSGFHRQWSQFCENVEYAIAEAGPAIDVMAANYGVPGKYCSPNIMFTRDTHNTGAFADLLYGTCRITLVRPADFLSLVPRAPTSDEEVRARLRSRIKSGLEVDSPYLVVQETPEGLEVEGHEGRNRMAAALAVAGNEPVVTYLYKPFSDKFFKRYEPVVLLGRGRRVAGITGGTGVPPPSGGIQGVN